MKHLKVRLHLLTWTATDDPPASGTLEQLVPACREGNRMAQKRLFDALAPKMMALCLRYVADRPTAEDVLQDGFVTLFSRLDSYSGAGSFEGWARRIFVNTALMHLRKTDALKLSDDISEARALFAEEATPVQQIGYKELMELIAALPSDSRTIFNMYVIEGYSHKEIAQSLGLNEATTRSKLQRARLRLQELIKEREKK